MDHYTNRALIVESTRVARSFDEEFELVSFVRANGDKSSIVAMNIVGDTILQNGHEQSGPLVLIKGVETGSTFERHLRSRSYVRATDMSASPSTSKNMIMVVGEHLGKVDVCEGVGQISPAPGQGGRRSSFFVELPLTASSSSVSSSSCAGQKGIIVPTAQSSSECEIYDPKVTTLKFPKEDNNGAMEAYLIAATASRCNSNIELLKTEVGILVKLLESGKTSSQNDAKDLLRGEAASLTLNTISTQGRHVWLGGIVDAQSEACKDAPKDDAEKEKHACNIKWTETTSPNSKKTHKVPVYKSGAWLAKAKVTDDGGIDIVKIFFTPKESSKVLPFVFVPTVTPGKKAYGATDQATDGYRVYWLVQSKDGNLLQTSFTNFPESMDWKNLVLKAHESIGSSSRPTTQVTITRTDSPVTLTLPTTSRAATPIETNFVVTRTRTPSASQGAAVSEFYAILFPPTSGEDLTTELIAYTLQTESSTMESTMMEVIGGAKVPSTLKMASSLITSSFFIEAPKTGTNAADNNQFAIATMASTIESEGDTPMKSVFTTLLRRSTTPSPTPTPIPVSSTPTSVPTSATPTTSSPTAPLPPTTISPLSSAPTGDNTVPSVPSPLYNESGSNGMSNTTKWAIFAGILVLVAGIAFVAYRFYYARYIAPMANSHPRSPMASQVDLDP